MPVERAEPIRRFYSWTRKRNYEGRWWGPAALEIFPPQVALAALITDKHRISSQVDALEDTCGGNVACAKALLVVGCE